MDNIQIGFLLPRSSLYPFMGRDIFNAFKSGAKFKGLQYSSPVFENIGFGANSQEIYAKAEKLILQEDVKLIIAFIDYMEALKLESLCAGNGCVLLILDPGGQIPEISSASRYRYTLSLQASYCSWLTGKAAAQDIKSRTLFCTSFYEGGYLQTHAFHKGIQTGGGEIAGYSFIPFLPSDFVEENLHSDFYTIKPDTVIANFSAEAGELFLTALSKIKSDLPAALHVSPFMLEESWLSGLDMEIERMKGHLTWFSALGHQENLDFVSAIRSDHDTAATVFSVLGWEASLFASDIFPMLIKSTPNEPNLKNIKFSGPRGEMILDSDHFFLSPAYQVESSKQKKAVAIKCLYKYPPDHDHFRQFKTQKPDGTVSKWNNTYLCI